MRFLHAIPLVLSLAAFGCTSSGTGDDPGDPPETECHDPNTAGCVVVSEKQRLTTPSASAADLEALVDGNTDFAFSLYQELRGQDGNLFYSPHSMSIALAMTWAGARNQTEQDMAAALRFTLPQDKLHPAFNALDLELASRGQGAQGSDGQGFRLNIANAIWGQVGFSFQDPFLDVLGQQYGAGMRVVDFVEQPGQALDLINGWVKDRTEGRIPKILEPDSINSGTRLVLTNAIYFNAAWENPFEESATQTGTFTTQAGADVQVPMMHGSVQVPYGEGTGFAAVELPYDGNELSMLLILPDDIGAFEQSLDTTRLDEVLSSLGEHMVDISMPKFEFESEFKMVDPLERLGMGIAFTGDADFSGINGEGGLAITDVIHKAFVNVNEAGTEAAAATAVVVGETSAPEPAQIDLNRPFLFLIRDIETGAVLFLGRVSDPS